jgi:hypothetical protein
MVRVNDQSQDAATLPEDQRSQYVISDETRENAARPTPPPAITNVNPFKGNETHHANFTRKMYTATERAEVYNRLRLQDRQVSCQNRNGTGVCLAFCVGIFIDWRCAVMWRVVWYGIWFEQILAAEFKDSPSFYPLGVAEGWRQGFRLGYDDFMEVGRISRSLSILIAEGGACLFVCLFFGGGFIDLWKFIAS